MLRYAILIAKAGKNYSAHSPDVPGCASTGKTVEEVKKNIKPPRKLPREGRAEEGAPPPEPPTIVAYVEVKDPASGVKPDASPPPPGNAARRKAPARPDPRPAA